MRGAKKMREIKCRAWDKSEEKMLYSNEQYYDYDFRCDENGNLLCYSNCSYADTFGYEHDEWIKLDNIMQYVGLRDGKLHEIYEGDIIKGLNRITDNDIPHRVIFHNGCFMFGNWNAHEYFNKHQFIEIIGNIFENPELMEDKA
jgi:uncharacterized phage protein (TIGR01671 family)